MTAINGLAGVADRPRGIWRQTTRTLGKLWRVVLALPDESARSLRGKPLPVEYYRFPPF